MKGKYLKAHLVLKRWGKTIPIAFLIDATRPAYPTAVYEIDTFRSLMGKKITSPRPLKANAYSFAHLESVKGDIISDKITQTGEEAGEFAAKILSLAVPISEEEYQQELEKIIWPSLAGQPKGAEPGGGGKERKKPAAESGKDMGEIATEVQKRVSQKSAKNGSENGRTNEESEITPQAPPLPEDMRRILALELIDSAERMNNEALKLLKSARLLLE